MSLPPGRFEGSYLGDRARLPAGARLECKICWWVYDPAAGGRVHRPARALALPHLRR